MIYKLNGQVFNPNQEMQIGNVKYAPGDLLKLSSQWATLGITEEPDPTPTPLTQEQLDEIRFNQRASSRDGIIAWMATQNMKRVREGVWTVAQLISLTEDAELVKLLSNIDTLSFEIAYGKVDSLTNPLLTQAIKDSWKAKLYANFYL